jgi:hypothetical protein
MVVAATAIMTAAAPTHGAVQLPRSISKQLRLSTCTILFLRNPISSARPSTESLTSFTAFFRSAFSLPIYRCVRELIARCNFAERIVTGRMEAIEVLFNEAKLVVFLSTRPVLRLVSRLS